MLDPTRRQQLLALAEGYSRAKFPGVKGKSLPGKLGKPADPGPSPKKGAKPGEEHLNLGDTIAKYNPPYHQDVLSDVKKGDHSWEVTKRVVQYAKHMKKNPESIHEMPPMTVVDGKWKDGSHRIAALHLLANHMDKKNPLWKEHKLKIHHYKSSEVDDGPRL